MWELPRSDTYIDAHFTVVSLIRTSTFFLSLFKQETCFNIGRQIESENATQAELC